LEDLIAGARIDVKEGKKNPADFALWKKCVGENADHILRWPSPWGEGFPGWHIECSAMSMKYLGETFDIHTGGEDNIFPHHESEIAQSEGATGKPFVRYWLHKRRIDMGTAKMSKSLGNVITLPAVIAQGFEPLDLRYYLLSVHYRTRLKFTWKGIEASRTSRRKITEWMEKVEEGSLRRGPSRGVRVPVHIERYSAAFSDALNRDLNTPAALAAVFDCMNATYREGVHAGEEMELLKAFIDCVQRTFGCFERDVSSIPREVELLLSDREAARKEGSYETADRIRRKIYAKGYEIRDTDTGPLLRKV